MKQLADMLLSGSQWYRRIRGGHWLRIGWGVWFPTEICAQEDWEGDSRCERWFNGRQQRTWVWCPMCTRDLCSQADSLTRDDGETVEYRCQACGLVSLWAFNAPAPILLSKRMSWEHWRPNLRIVS